MDDQKDQIIAVLSKETRPLTITAIADKSGLNRHAVARQMDSLELLGKVRKIEKGSAKKYMLVQSIPVSSLIDVSSDLILLLNARLEIQFLNAAAATYLSVSPGQVIGERLDLMSLSFFSTPQTIGWLNSALLGKERDMRLLTEDGIWFEITIISLSLFPHSSLTALIATDISEKVEQEEELRISQEKYRLSFLSSPDAIILIDYITGNLIEVNETACTMTGYSQDEMIGNTFHELQIIKSSKEREAYFISALSKGYSGPFETIAFRKNGEQIYISLSANIIYIKGHKCILATIRDISEIKKNEELIRKSEELYRRIADNTSDVIWILDIDSGKFAYVSPSVERLRGFSPEEVLLQTIEEVMTEESSIRLISHVSPLYRDYKNGIRNPDNSIRIDQIHRDGSVIPTEVVATFIEEEGAIRVLGVSRDITKRVQVEEKLKKVERYYQQLSKSMKDVFTILDPDTLRFRYVSPSVTRVLGYSPEELTQSSFDRVLDPSLSVWIKIENTARKNYFLSTPTQSVYYTDEFELKTRSGSTVWIKSVSWFAENEESGGPEIYGVLRDITGQKRNPDSIEPRSDEPYGE